ncbi:unnamed protein product [Linum trigynum]|uniref:SWIM-type domain-containing protein n=1 Tax=Linum trigynum TaxID=586398 RepID=A0AAV2E4T5_9ROSI
MTPSKSRFFRQHRSLSVAVQRRLELNDSAGIRLTKSVRSIAIEEGGYENMGCLASDCRRHVQNARNLRLGEGDARAMLKLFENMKKENEDFFYAYDFDDDGRLTNVLWVDARSRAAYKEFGDVITFDTTYLLNKYNMPVAPFVGINHHGQSILFGCALVSKEDTETFVWLFSRWLECMKSPPATVITDQCQSMRNAIEKFFPDARHRWCIWHILKKVPQKLGSHDMFDELCNTLKKCVYEPLSIEEFEESWKNMIIEFNLENNEWLEELYQLAPKWIPVFVNDTFWAGMLSTQRSEGMNAYFDGYLNPTSTLKQFLEQYQVALKDKIEKEMLADCRSCVAPIQCALSMEFEEQFQCIYTNEKFEAVQEQLVATVHCFEKVEDIDGERTTYLVQDRGRVLYDRLKKREFKVIYDQNSGDVSCNCRMFEFKGILCRHIFHVLMRNEVEVIDAKYITQRWRKDICRVYSKIKVGYVGEVSSGEMDRFAYLDKRLKRLANSASEHDGKFQHLVNCIHETEKLFDEWEDEVPSSQEATFVSGDQCLDSSRALAVLQDPVVAQTRGRPKSKRIPSSWEGRKKKSKRARTTFQTPTMKTSEVR